MSNPIDRIKNLIQAKKENTFFHHMFIFFTNYHEWCGKTDKNSFEIWKLSYSIGHFYPVIKGEIVNDNDVIKVKLNHSLNPFGKFLSFLILGGCLFGITTQTMRFESLTTETFLPRFGFLLLMLGLVAIVLWIFRKFYMNQVEYVKEYISTKG